MSSTPWRRGNVKLEVDASVEHVESASVPGGAPAAGTGKFWVRDDTPNVPVFTDDGGTDWVLNESGGGTTSGETGLSYEGLQFYIDDDLQDSIGGEVDWQKKSYTV